MQCKQDAILVKRMMFLVLASRVCYLCYSQSSFKSKFLCVLNKFKSDGGLTRCYVLQVCNTSRTGFDMKKWVDRIIEFEIDSGKFYLLSNSKGKKEGNF